MRKCKSFRSSFGIDENSDSKINEELKVNLSRSIEYGNALMKENEMLREEVFKFREDSGKFFEESFEREKEQLIKNHSFEKENLEQELADLRLELNSTISSNSQLIHEKEELSRDLMLTKKDLKRVMKNNNKLRKEKVLSDKTERFLTRRLSLNIDVHDLDACQAPLQKCSTVGSMTPPKSNFSYAYSTPQQSPSKSPIRDLKIKQMSETSYLELKKSYSKQRMKDLKKKEDLKKRTHRRRVCDGFSLLRESLEKVKQCIFESSIWWSQKNFEMCRNFNVIARDENEKSEVEILKKKIKKLENVMKKKEEKYIKQIAHFLEMFEVNKIYENNE